MSFPSGQRVTHIYTGNEYKILFSPADNEVRESSHGDKVYVYQSFKDGKIWVRPASEFEDGRFESAETT